MSNVQVMSNSRVTNNGRVTKRRVVKSAPSRRPSPSQQVLHDTVMRLRLDGQVVAKLHLFAILTAARMAEARHASWHGVDVEAAKWSLSAEHSKSRSAYCVALSQQSLELLQALPRLAGNHLVFPSPSGEVLSDLRVGMTARAMKLTPVYGFRTAFLDWHKKRTGETERPVELDDELMQAWADFIDPRDVVAAGALK
jgi:integrase